MTRFIIITFAFLAFAFYEMSGGADFDPQKTLAARVDGPVEIKTERLEQTAQTARNEDLAQNVTRVNLSLTSVDEVPRANTLRTGRARIDAPAESIDIVSQEEPVIIIPSLIVDKPLITRVNFGAAPDADTDPSPTETGEFDVRAVTGDSVNVRGGPGTNHAVVSRLTRGDKVDILEDPGQGWVKLRPLGGGNEGWVADFLLNDG